MSITIRRSAERGHADHGWLKSYHSFSFADYYDPAHMGFGALRVINEDRVAAGAGFGTHGHRDMEIVSYVLSGALEHRDSMGNGSVLRAGDVQRMSAGRGVYHSEYNGSTEEPVHFLQIWIVPSQTGLDASYQEFHVGPDEKRGRLRLIAAPEGGERVLALHQDARLHAGLFDAGERAELPLAPGRRAYVHLVRGELAVNGEALAAGDAALLAGEGTLRFEDGRDAEVLVFDLA